jgi:hypothetical protein
MNNCCFLKNTWAIRRLIEFMAKNSLRHDVVKGIGDELCVMRAHTHPEELMLQYQ